ncbi:MAG: YncE family protein [Candidatus Gastranaerophilaceae bacterium]
MQKLLSALGLSLLLSCSAMAAQVPQEVQDFINKDFPNTNFRFDGAIVLPDNTMYLPVFPAKTDKLDNLSIKSVYPLNTTMKQKPDLMILNNNFVLLKVINTNGKKTVINLKEVPEELQSALLPQDILLPKGLVLPENLKGIIGDIDVSVTQDTGLKINNTRKKAQKSTTPVEPLENKTFYVSSGVNKNIQVIQSNSRVPEYSLQQKAVINDIKAYNNEFMLVTYFDSKVMNIISLMDEKVIKEVNFETCPEQIIIDNDKKLAYITSSTNSSVYVFSLETMTLKRQLKINGLCEKFTLSEDGTKLFYVDRNTDNIWTIELDNNYYLKNIGSFPNVAKIAYVNGEIYIISRTKNRVAIVDYDTVGLISELEVCEKPVDLFAKNNDLYILGAQDNIVEVLDTSEDLITDKLFLNTNAFATNITPIDNSNLIMVTNALSGLYSVIDTETKEVVKTSPIDVPVRAIVVTNKVKTIK